MRRRSRGLAGITPGHFSLWLFSLYARFMALDLAVDDSGPDDADDGTPLDQNQPVVADETGEEDSGGGLTPVLIVLVLLCAGVGGGFLYRRQHRAQTERS